jgi:hypothetical protein
MKFSNFPLRKIIHQDVFFHMDVFIVIYNVFCPNQKGQKTMPFVRLYHLVNWTQH